MSGDEDPGELFRAFPEPLLLLNAQFRVRGANAASERLFADPLRPLVGRGLEEIFVPGRVAGVAAYLAGRPPEGTSKPRMVAEIVDGHRRVVPVELSAGDWGGEAVRTYALLLRPMSEAAPPGRPSPELSLPQLLMAERLKELV